MVRHLMFHNTDYVSESRDYGIGPTGYVVTKFPVKEGDWIDLFRIEDGRFVFLTKFECTEDTEAGKPLNGKIVAKIPMVDDGESKET